MTIQTSNIKGYRFRGSYDLRPHTYPIISLSLAGAKFLTGWELFRAHLIDNITAPNPVWEFLKNNHFV